MSGLDANSVSVNERQTNCGTDEYGGIDKRAALVG
jgi:hypothetical protein